MALQHRLRFVVLALVPALPGLSVAAEPVFPPGSSVGLVPPRGMAPSARFKGLEGPDGTSVVVTEMPAAAMPEVTAGFTLDKLKQQGFTSRERQSVKVGERDALLLFGDQKSGVLNVRKWILVTASPSTMALVVATMPKGDATYGEAELREALLTTAIRQPASLDEQVAALPFRLGDRAGFRLVPQIVGDGLILTNGPKNIDPDGEQPSVVNRLLPRARARDGKSGQLWPARPVDLHQPEGVRRRGGPHLRARRRDLARAPGPRRRPQGWADHHRPADDPVRADRLPSCSRDHAERAARRSAAPLSPGRGQPRAAVRPSGQGRSGAHRIRRAARSRPHVCRGRRDRGSG